MTKIYLIKDDLGMVWGIAPSSVQAKRQVSWFLPKGNYTIELNWVKT